MSTNLVKTSEYLKVKTHDDFKSGYVNPDSPLFYDPTYCVVGRNARFGHDDRFQNTMNLTLSIETRPGKESDWRTDEAFGYFGRVLKIFRSYTQCAKLVASYDTAHEHANKKKTITFNVTYVVTPKLISDDNQTFLA